MQNEAAQSVRYVSPTEIEIVLKDGKFSDGTPVTAEDAVATLNWFKSNRTVFRDILDNVASITSPRKKTILIRLKKENQNFLRAFAAPNYGVYPAKFLAKADWNEPVGCGKYRVVENDSSKHLVRLSSIATGNEIEFDLKEGSVISREEARTFDIIPRPFRSSLGDLDGYKEIASFDPKQVYVSINTTLPRWTNKRLRCELLNSLDLGPIRQAYGQEAESSNQLFPRGVVGYDDSLRTEQSTERVRQTKEVCIDFLGLSVPENLRSVYVKAFKSGFADVRTQVIENPADLGKQFAKSNCDVLVSGFKSNFLDGYEFLVPFIEPTASIVGPVESTLAAKLRESQSLPDPSMRGETYRDLQNKILGDCVVKPVVTIPKQSFLIRANHEMPGVGQVPLSEYDLSGVR